MAKTLRNKLANMALCCTVATGVVGQAAPVLATQNESSMEQVVTLESVEQESVEQATELEVEEAIQTEEIIEVEEAIQAEEIIEVEEAIQTEEIIEVEEAIQAEEVIQIEETKEVEEAIETEEIIEIEEAEELEKLEMLGEAIELASLENQEQEIAVMDAGEPWEEAVADAVYSASINLEDDGSIMAFVMNAIKGCFTTTSLPMEVVEDGKVKLKLKLSKDMTVMGVAANDVVNTLEQKVNGSYEELTLEYINDSSLRYVMTEIELEDINDVVELKFIANVMGSTKTVELNLSLTEDTKAQIKTPVSMKTSHTDETVYGAKDGNITITAQGGSSNYEYTVDGGQTWKDTNVFEGLTPGEYSVAVRDKDNTQDVTSYETVTIVEGTSISANEEKYAVNIQVLKEDVDEISHAAGYFTTENAELRIENGKAYLTLQVVKDAGTFKDIMKNLELKVGDQYEALDIKYLDDESVRYITTEVPLNRLDDVATVKCYVVLPFMSKEYPVRIKLTQESIDAIEGKEVEKETPVTISNIEKVDGTNGSITVIASGGNGTYEYTIDGGVNWQEANQFTGLAVGKYQVGVRDAQSITNVSGYQAIELVTVSSSDDSNSEDEKAFKDGEYSVDISLYKEKSDEVSMAASFFNKTGLPLRIKDGKGYLTIQVLKDGLGMTDVITSLEQRIDGEYTSLNLNNLNNSSVRYVTTEIVFDVLDQAAYVKCGITAMGSSKPVLRIKLDTNSIQEGAGSIDTSLQSDTANISRVTAENGKVTITLSTADDSLTADSFKGKIYLNGSSKGKELTLKNFNMNGTTVTFTYDEVAQAEKDQSVIVGITFSEAEVKSSEFIVKAVTAQAPVTILGLKTNAQEIKYIKGYENGTFKPNGEVTKAETLSMLALLVDAPSKDYYVTNMQVLQSTKDETSMAAQFFKTEGITVTKQADKYLVAVEISNEGLGFTDIITGIEQKVNGTYQRLEVVKSKDMKKAYITLELDNLNDAVTLKTGIAPMGQTAPELRLVFGKLVESEFASSYSDVDMWAKDSIILFESQGVIGGDSSKFSPNSAITRGEFIKIVAQVAGLETLENTKHDYKDISGSEYETYIAAATEAGLINGYSNGTFKPEGTLTRAEAVTIINRLLGYSAETDVEAENQFTDVKSNHWAYQDILKASTN